MATIWCDADIGELVMGDAMKVHMLVDDPRAGGDAGPVALGELPLELADAGAELDVCGVLSGWQLGAVLNAPGGVVRLGVVAVPQQDHCPGRDGEGDDDGQGHEHCAPFNDDERAQEDGNDEPGGRTG